MRSFEGVKARLAMELTGFQGVSKTFRNRFRDVDDNSHKLYSPFEIRKIRLALMGLPADFVRPGTFQPPIIDARMAKGGVGKTTVTGNVSSCLAISGYRVLMIDGDPQASLTGLFGISWKKDAIVHISELMRRVSKGEKSHIEQAVHHLYPNGMLDLIPADIRMADDQWLSSTMNREFAFQRLLDEERAFFSQYDVIVIDSAPGASLLATTFMVTSKTLLTVVEPEGQAIDALEVLESNVKEINNAFRRNDINLDIHIVVNKYNQTKAPHQSGLAFLAGKYPSMLNDNVVRNFVGFLREVDPENIHLNGPVLEKEPNSIGARDILSLTQSLERLYNISLDGNSPNHEHKVAV